MKKPNSENNKETLPKEHSTKNDILAEVVEKDSGEQDANFNEQYYIQYQKSYKTGLQLSQEMLQLVSMRDELWGQLAKLDEKTLEFKDTIRGEPSEKKKRSRRGAEEIERKYKCHVHNCEKSYGSEGSLNQHIRLKHPKKKEEFIDSALQ